MPTTTPPGLVPRECELCECQQYRWNCRPTGLKTDPPSTCVCDHPAYRHHFREQEAITSE